MRSALGSPARVALVLAALLVVSPAVRAELGGKQSGVNLADLDRTCAACDDFYQFADGGWIASHPLPADKARYAAFDQRADGNLALLHEILESAAGAGASPGSNEQKIGDFYASCMNQAAIDAAGTSPIESLLAFHADASRNAGTELAQAAAHLERDGVPVFFRFSDGPDAHQSSSTIAQLRQGGLGLPDRDYYLKDDGKTEDVRAAYVAHVTKMFALAGDAAALAARRAQSVFDFETKLAQNSMDRVTRRNPDAIYNKMSLAELQALAPGFDWKTFFTAEKIAPDAPINVAQPDFFKALSGLLAATPGETVRAYLRFHTFDSYAYALPSAFAAEDFAFHGKVLSGVPEQEARWKVCVRATDERLGDALGERYVARTFPPSAREQALEMVGNIRQTLRSDLTTLDWMTPQTRARAIEKLDAFQLKIGYPDKWRDYRSLTIERGSYGANLIATSEYVSDERAARIGKPTDRTLWNMSPPTVNAYYSDSLNEIVFPAGVLQPPFYNKDADMAVNYGAIGAIIGHESTHGFDDSGRKFDPQGDLTDWWAPQDAARFTARAGCVIKQFDALSPLAGVEENGKLVQGEEIADLGGVTIAFKAFQKWQATHPRRTLDGFTPEQRFFLGFAREFASSERPEDIALRANTDPHAYPKFRVNATLANVPGFAEAWFCALNRPMVRSDAERCRIW